MSIEGGKSRISEIAHLFLTEVKDSSGNGEDAAFPRRRPGRERNKKKSKLDFKEDEFSSNKAEERIEEHKGDVVVSLLITSHLGKRAEYGVRCYLAYLMERGEKLSFLRPSADGYELKVFATSPERLVVLSSPEFGSELDKWVRVVDDVCVCVSPVRDDIVLGYQLIKGVSSIGGKVGIFVVDVNEEQGEEIYNRLSKTANEFENVKVGFVGWCKLDENEDSFEVESIYRLGKLEANELIKSAKKVIMESVNKKKDEKVGSWKQDTSGMEKDTIKIVHLDEVTTDETGFLGVHIGKKLLGVEYKPIASDLMDFMRSAGLPVGRFRNSEDGECVTIFVVLDANKSLFNWIINNYPHRRDQIWLIVDDFTEFEKQVLKDKYPSVKILKALRGIFEGRDSLIISLG